MKEKLKSIGKNRWELPKGSRKKEPRMRVPGRLIGTKKIIDWAEDTAIEQLTNVTTLPGIVKYTVGMPDIHWGYGLPMGAVSAFDEDEGIISAGMTGFDINCGIRLIKTNLTSDEVMPRIRELIDALFRNVPSGVGSKSKFRLSPGELEDLITMGAAWAVENGFGVEDDLLHLEEGGVMEGADPDKVSPEAKKRGMPQAGTLGAGNHFLEVQRIEELYDSKTAEAFGLSRDNIAVMLHCGSRGFGHQIATDYLRILDRAVKKYNIVLPDHQLVCAPATSQEGQDYFAAMKAGVNYAFANRQVMTDRIRATFEEVFKRDWRDLGMDVLYDVCHNICKYEEHVVDGERRMLYVHRKGSTRAFPPGHKDVPAVYRGVGQPVLIAGSMGTSSYVLSGTGLAMDETFGSTCHGAGRAMSRKKAIRSWRGDDVKKALAKEGKIVVATSPRVIAEEAPAAYKDVDEVIESVHGAGISTKVARLTPLAVAKG
jgi:tRNA-splicing ligase RtcB